jgi:CheY-like chemotaxis protein
MSPATLNGLRILIVEDNFVVADSLRFVIGGYGGAVSAIAPTIDKALAALATAPIDVAILDINLAGTNVAPFAEHLQARGVPFVFLTGYGDAELLPEALRDAPRFDKPVHAERLVAALQRLVPR